MTLKRNATLKLYIQWAIGCKDITKKRRNLFLASKGILLYKTLCKRAKRAAYTQNKIVTKGFWLRPHRWLCHEFILEDEVLYKIRKVRKKYYLLIFPCTLMNSIFVCQNLDTQRYTFILRLLPLYWTSMVFVVREQR